MQLGRRRRGRRNYDEMKYCIWNRKDVRGQGTWHKDGSKNIHVSHHLKTQKINMASHEEKLRLCNTSEMTLWQSTLGLLWAYFLTVSDH